jgi:hypothetical protein
MAFSANSRSELSFEVTKRSSQHRTNSEQSQNTALKGVLSFLQALKFVARIWQRSETAVADLTSRRDGFLLAFVFHNAQLFPLFARTLAATPSTAYKEISEFVTCEVESMRLEGVECLGVESYVR